VDNPRAILLNNLNFVSEETLYLLNVYYEYLEDDHIFQMIVKPLYNHLKNLISKTFKIKPHHLIEPVIVVLKPTSDEPKRYLLLTGLRPIEVYRDLLYIMPPKQKKEVFPME
jgi:hypothetical protein